MAKKKDIRKRRLPDGTLSTNYYWKERRSTKTSNYKLACEIVKQWELEETKKKAGVDIPEVRDVYLRKLLEEYAGSLKLNAQDRQVETVTYRIQKIIDMSGCIRLKELTPDIVTAILIKLKNEPQLLPGRKNPMMLAQSTVAKYLVAINSMLNDAVKKQKIPFNPIASVRFKVDKNSQKHARRPLEDEDLPKFLDAAKRGPLERFQYSGINKKTGAHKKKGKLSEETRKKKEFEGIRNYTAYYCFILLGLRLNELRQGLWSDVDFKKMTYTVRPDVSYKKEGGDVLPLSTELKKVLLEWKAVLSPGPNDLLIPGLPSKFVNTMKKDLALAGIKYEDGGKFADVHSLKHLFCTRVGQRVKNVKEAQKLTRHSSPAMVMNYTHTNLEDVRGVVDDLPNLTDGKSGIIGAKKPGKSE